MSKTNDLIRRFLGEPAMNLMHSIYDDYVEVNVKIRSRSGINTFIIRRQIGKCCDWCKGLAGIYEKGKEPEDIYRRHDNCKCVVTFLNEKGKYVDVWSKQEFDSQRQARIHRIEELENGSNSNAQKQVAYARRNVTLHTYDDPIREKIGSAEQSHPEELERMVKVLTDNGVEIDRRKGMSYQPNPTPGKPGKIVMEDGASISAWKHEYKHFEDDKDSGFRGFRLFADPEKAAKMESDAYDVEIELAKQLGYNDIAKRLMKLKKNRMKDFDK